MVHYFCSWLTNLETPNIYWLTNFSLETLNNLCQTQIKMRAKTKFCNIFLHPPVKITILAINANIQRAQTNLEYFPLLIEVIIKMAKHARRDKVQCDIREKLVRSVYLSYSVYRLEYVLHD